MNIVNIVDRFGSLWIVLGSLWVVVDRCGSLWVVVDRFGSLWVVPRFSSYHPLYPKYRDPPKNFRFIRIFDQLYEISFLD